MTSNLQELEKILPLLSDDEAVEMLEQMFMDKFRSDPSYTLPFMHRGLDLAKKLPGREKEVSFTIYLAFAYSRTGEYNKAVDLFHEALDLAKDFPDKTKTAEIYNGIGALYLENEDYSKALEYFYRGLEYDIKPINARLYNNIGQAFKEKKHLDKALYYFNKSAEIKRDLNQDDSLAFYIVSIGDIYREQGQYEKALDQYFECLDLCINKNFGTIQHVVEANIGLAYSLLNLPEKAIIYFEKSWEGAQKIRDPYLMSFNGVSISKHYHSIGNLEESNVYALEVLKVSEGRAQKEYHLEALNLLQRNYETMGDFESSLSYAKRTLESQKELLRDVKTDKIDGLLKAKDQQITLLEKKNREIGEKNAELRQFAQIVAHDLKEPLRTIGSFSNLLLRRYSELLDQNGKEFIDFVMNGTRQMDNLLSDLLAYVTLDNSDLSLTTVDFNEVIELVKQNLHFSIESAQAQIIHKDLPITKAYSQVIVLVFQNLVHNAIKFRSDQPCVVKIQAEEMDHCFSFSIEDNGIGIKPEYQKRIFSIFTQLDNKKEGTGIGLAICKKIVQLHEGSMRVESSLGGGSKFIFTIPKSGI